MGNPDPKINRLYPVSGGVIQSVIQRKMLTDITKFLLTDLRTVWRCWSVCREAELDHSFIRGKCL